MALAEGPLGRLAHGGEGLDQQLVQRLALFVALAQPSGSGAQVLVRQAFQVRFHRVDRVDRLFNPRQNTVVGRAEKLPEQPA